MATQFKRLMGAGRAPLTGGPLGRDFQQYKAVAERVEDRVAKLDSDLPAEEHRAATVRIEAEETRTGERCAVATRTSHGGIEQKNVVGIAAAYDHWDFRANDPQLHTHVVVSNKVMTIDDGVWRARERATATNAHVGAGRRRHS